MERHRPLIIVVVLLVVVVLLAGVLVALVGAAVGGFALGDLESTKGMTIQEATPRQLAAAMRGDYFYSEYRKSALLVSGTVASVVQRGALYTVAFESDSSYGVSCELWTATRMPRPGATFTVLTMGHAAERQPAGVLLRDCVVP